MTSLLRSFLFISSVLAALLIGDANAGTLEPDGRLLSESRQCFEMLRAGPDGLVVFGHTLQTIEATEHDGEDAWRIVVHQKGANGGFDMRDEFLLRADNLLPISLHNKAMRGGKFFHEISLDYDASGVNGTRKEHDGSVKEIDVTFDQPRWEGNLWGLTFAALPLEEGERYELPYYQYDKGEGSFIVETVKRDENIITIRGGTDPEQLMEYRIQASPRAEIGYGGEQFRQQPADDCSAFGD